MYLCVLCRAVIGTLDALQRVKAEHSEDAAVLEGRILPSDSPQALTNTSDTVSSAASHLQSGLNKIVESVLQNTTSQTSSSQP